MSNTTIFIDSILSIYYIKHNYMFRPLMLAIFRLYMNTYQVVIQIYVCFLVGIDKTRSRTYTTPSIPPKNNKNVHAVHSPTDAHILKL